MSVSVAGFLGSWSPDTDLHRHFGTGTCLARTLLLFIAVFCITRIVRTQLRPRMSLHLFLFYGYGSPVEPLKMTFCQNAKIRTRAFSLRTLSKLFQVVIVKRLEEEEELMSKWMAYGMKQQDWHRWMKLIDFTQQGCLSHS